MTSMIWLNKIFAIFPVAIVFKYHQDQSILIMCSHSFVHKCYIYFGLAAFNLFGFLFKIHIYGEAVMQYFDAQ